MLCCSVQTTDFTVSTNTQESTEVYRLDVAERPSQRNLFFLPFLLSPKKANCGGPANPNFPLNKQKQFK
jgi:hypothetical protein